MRVVDYWKIFRARWLTIFAITAVSGLLGFGLAAIQPKQYTSDASGMLTAGSSSDLGSALTGDSFAKSRVTSYLDVANSRSVAERVKENLGLEESVDALRANTTVSNPPETSNIKVSVTASTPEQARDIAEAWIVAIGEQSLEIEGAGTIVQFQSLDSAQIPTSPSSPDIRLYVLGGILVGAVMGIAYAIVWHQFDRRIRAVEHVESTTGVAVIGTIPRRKTGGVGNDRIVTSKGGNDRESDDISEYAVAESMRRIRTNLQFMDVDNPPRVITVTSSIPGEGKSFVIANLANTIAQAGEQVVVIDGDLRRPVVAETFGIVGSVGLTDVLAGTAELRDVLQPWGDTGNLAVLAAGSVPPNPSELLSSKTMGKLLDEISQHAIVLIDTPPLLPVTDAALLTAKTSGAIIVASANKTTFDELGQSLANLRKVKGRSLGVIINRVPMRGAQADGYGYRYRNYYRRSADETTSAKGTARSFPDTGSQRAAAEGSPASTAVGSEKSSPQPSHGGRRSRAADAGGGDS